MQAAIDHSELIQAVHDRLVELNRLSITYSEEALAVHLNEITTTPSNQSELVEMLVRSYIADVEQMESELPVF